MVKYKRKSNYNGLEGKIICNGTVYYEDLECLNNCSVRVLIYSLNNSKKVPLLYFNNMSGIYSDIFINCAASFLDIMKNIK